MSITTGSGDTGTTGLPGGQRVPKDHPVIECLGALDELSAFLGDARCAVADERTRNIIKTIQEELITLMGVVAGVPAKTAPNEERLSAWAREFERELPMRRGTSAFGLGAGPRDFVVPGANPPSAKLDLARTACRRAERRLTTLPRQGELSEGILPYINRLSDLLFLLARYEEEAF
jgi:cob(I)alamin adenosyltransferase